MPISRQQRCSRHTPCLICGGHPDIPPGRRQRCTGYLSRDGQYAYCTREERAGGLAPRAGTTPPAWAHRLNGQCACGLPHGGEPAGVALGADTRGRASRSPNGHPLDRGLTFRAPVPDSAPPMPWLHPKANKPVAVYPWTDRQGRVLFYTVRYEFEEGGARKKVVTPRTMWEAPGGVLTWEKAGPPPLWIRPLFNLGELAARPDVRVLVVEGEKAAVAGARHFPDFVVTTWMGGAASFALTDWSPLGGRDVIFWPDADAPDHWFPEGKGTHYMRQAAKKAREAGATSLRMVEPPDGVPSGWDLVDAIESEAAE